MKMPPFTLEEKARAFDILWENCGNGHAVFDRWKYGDTTPVNSNEACIERIPVYHFTIAYVGDVDYFRDVLYALTKEKP